MPCGTVFLCGHFAARRLNQKYKEFSKAAGLPEQRDRMKVLYPDQKSTDRAAKLKIKRDAEAPIRASIKSGEISLWVIPEKQSPHMEATAEPGKSVVTISMEELQELVYQKSGSGEIRFKKGTLDWNHTEIVDAGKEIGYTVNLKGDIIKTSSMKIHYRKAGVHVVPFSGRWGK